MASSKDRAQRPTRRSPSAAGAGEAGERVPAVGLLLVAAVAVQMRSPRLPDADAFYHLRHAQLLLERGFLDTSFPWTWFSVIRTAGADLWYGFHLLLAPLSAIEEPERALRAAGVVVTTLMLLSVYGAFRALGVRFAGAWTLALLVSTPDQLFRMAMVRPHVLSFGLALLAFALLSTSGRPWPLALVGAVAASLHLALAWVYVLIAVVVAAVARLHGRPWARAGAALVGGLVVGALLRPAPLGGLHLAWVQVGRLMLEKARGTPLRFGRELVPMTWTRAVDQFWPLLPLLAVAAALFAWSMLRRRGRDVPAGGRVAIWSAAILAATFFAIAMTSARRAAEFALGFGLVACALTCTHALAALRRERPRPWGGRVLAVAAVAALALAAAVGYRSVRISATFFDQTSPFDKFRGASLWLGENARPGEIVFHPHWDNFAPLFYWNPANRYVGGMDPVFHYAYDPGLYWKAHHLATDRAAERTCPRRDCTPEQTVPTYEVVRDDFEASWVFVQPLRTPRLYAYLVRTPEHYAEVFGSGTEAVFRVLGATGGTRPAETDRE